MDPALVAVAVALIVLSFAIGYAAKRCPAPPTKERLFARIQQGKRGKWRFSVTDRDGVTIFVSAVSGYQSEKNANDMLDRINNSEIVVTLAPIDK